jgi:type II secretory pathway component PulF
MVHVVFVVVSGNPLFLRELAAAVLVVLVVSVLPAVSMVLLTAVLSTPAAGRTLVFIAVGLLAVMWLLVDLVAL